MTVAPTRALSRIEFIALMAMLMATIAFSIDAMLPAMPDITDQLTPDAPNRAQLIITSFVLGLGLGVLVSGPISDAIGRKPVLVGGAVLFCAGALLAWQAESLELTLAARLIQGLGASGPRVVALAIIRDLFRGREMAQIVSIVMVVFSLVPAIAPAMAAGIIALLGWRSIYLAFVLFSLISVLWLSLRQPETLPVEARRPFRAEKLTSALREIAANRIVRTTIGAQSLAFGCLFATLSSTFMIYDETFGEGERFPFWFALTAAIAACGGIINASLVVRIGMRRLAGMALGTQIAVTGLYLAGGWLQLWQPDSDLGFWLYFLWSTGIFVMVSFTIGNLNAIALEPMGHIAGTATSVITSVATVAAVLIAAPLGLAFNGTPVPVTTGILVCAIIARLLVPSADEPQAA